MQSASEEKKDKDGVAKPAPSASSYLRLHRRPDVEIGEMVKVQTNLGWELVTIMKKYENGRLDIQFEDGELMREAMPRILKRTPTAPQPEERCPSSASEGGGRDAH